MQFIVITGPTYQDAIKKLPKALKRGDGIELRIDFFPWISMEEIQNIINLCKKKAKKIILTIRSKKGGGRCELSLVEIEKKILSYAALGPTYMDIEYSLPKALFEEVNEKKVKTIASYHNFHYTPKSLETIFRKMEKKMAYCYKICTTAQNLSDAFRMLQFIHKKKQNAQNIIGLCMGEHGLPTREDGLKVGNYINYKVVYSRDKVAKGIDFA